MASNGGKERKKRAPAKAVSVEMAKAAWARVQSGVSSLIAESKKLGYNHNGPLRAALRELLGKKEYADGMKGRTKKEKKTKAPKPKKEKAAKPAKEKKPRAPRAKKEPVAKAAAEVETAPEGEGLVAGVAP